MKDAFWGKVVVSVARGTVEESRHLGPLVRVAGLSDGRGGSEGLLRPTRRLAPQPASPSASPSASLSTFIFPSVGNCSSGSRDQWTNSPSGQGSRSPSLEGLALARGKS